MSDWLKDVEKINKPITWWHGTKDINVQIELAKKTVDRLREKGNIQFKAVSQAGHASLSINTYKEAMVFCKTNNVIS